LSTLLIPFLAIYLSFQFWALFEKYVIDHFSGVICRLAEPQPAARIFHRTTALPEIPPAPLYQRGVAGDFRDGLTKQDFLTNFKFLILTARTMNQVLFEQSPILGAPEMQAVQDQRKYFEAFSNFS